jgi:hypothetical protein
MFHIAFIKDNHHHYLNYIHFLNIWKNLSWEDQQCLTPHLLRLKKKWFKEINDSERRKTP